MSDRNEANGMSRSPKLASMAGWLSKDMNKDDDKERDTGEEGACPAFGYLRGLHDRALAVEFRFRNGNSEWFPYSWLGPWKYDPSAGVLLKFTGDLVTLVLIRGSNLGALVNTSVNLTDRGLQRHRIVWVREMDDLELRRAGKGEPTIDCIVIAEFASQEEQDEWLKKKAPGFERKQE
jgi:hypothetical protein